MNVPLANKQESNFLCRMISTFCIDLSWKTALKAANALIFQCTGNYLSDLEIVILHGAWNNYTYEQIALAKGYTSSYLCKDIGHHLWKNLSMALKVKVSKTNFKAALKREWQKYTQAISSNHRERLAQFIPADNITLFEGLIALDSTFYLERSSIETICGEEILKPGTLVRIEGAKWSGKTSLVNRILEPGNLPGRRTVYLDFNTIDQEIVRDTNKLFIWLSTMISHQLNIENKLHNCCNNISICNDNYTAYFENWILNRVESDLILALDNIDRIFYEREVAKTFLKLLCDWHKRAKSNYYWSRLKLITTQSTKVALPFDSERFFSNTAIPIMLKEFNFQQVKTLAGFYQLDWSDKEISRLMNEVGGNPYLVRLAMYQTKIKNLTLRH